MSERTDKTDVTCILNVPAVFGRAKPPPMSRLDFERIRLAAFCTSRDPSFEDRMRTEKAGLVQFFFLNKDSEFNGLYRDLVAQFNYEKDLIIPPELAKASRDCSPIDRLRQIVNHYASKKTVRRKKTKKTNTKDIDWENFSLVYDLTQEDPEQTYNACSQSSVETTPLSQKHLVIQALKPVSTPAASSPTVKKQRT